MELAVLVAEVLAEVELMVALLDDEVSVSSLLTLNVSSHGDGMDMTSPPRPRTVDRSVMVNIPLSPRAPPASAALDRVLRETASPSGATRNERVTLIRVCHPHTFFHTSRARLYRSPSASPKW